MTQGNPRLPKERIAQIDILRGFALLGILIVNAFGYNASFFDWSGFYRNNFTDPLNLIIFNSVVNFFSDKFIFIFSFLFGFGFALMHDNHLADDKVFAALYSRRLCALLLFGALHVLLFWAGDILLMYALCGFILLSLRKAKPTQLLTLSIFFYFFGVIYIAVQAVVPALPDSTHSTANIQLASVISTYRDGSLWETVKLRLYEYYSLRYINLFYYMPKILGLFLFGYWCKGKDILTKINGKKVHSIVIAVLLLVSGILLNNYTGNLLGLMVSDTSPFSNAVYMAIYETDNILLGFSYILLILILSNIGIFRWILQPLRYAGRMALTNYLLQSVVFTFIMCSWGLGYFGSFYPWHLILMAIGIFVIEITISKLWLKKFRFGPMEWIWRMITYKKRIRNRE